MARTFKAWKRKALKDPAVRREYEKLTRKPHPDSAIYRAGARALHDYSFGEGKRCGPKTCDCLALAEVAIDAARQAEKGGGKR